MDDLISRQAAIDKINERQRKLIYCFGFENDMVKIMDIARSIIIAMPSAQPDSSACWGCNCPKMEQKTFSEMVRLHDAERRTDGVDC